MNRIVNGNPRIVVDAEAYETNWHGPLRGEVAKAVSGAIDECASSQTKYGDFASMHEAYGVLAEEVDELFDAIKMKQGVLSFDKISGHPMTRGECIREEAIQVAAVALRIAEQAGRVTR